MQRTDAWKRLRPGLLLTVLVVAVALAACGRATEEQINQALGITPTPTLTTEQMATATAAPGATAAARTALAQTGGTPGGEAAVLGDVRRGQLAFLSNCTRCHRGPNASGGDLLAPGGAGTSVSYELLLPIIRQGHENGPGPVAETRIDDGDIHDLVAYIQSEAAR